MQFFNHSFTSCISDCVMFWISVLVSMKLVSLPTFVSLAVISTISLISAFASSIHLAEKKEHGEVSVTQPHLISCFEYIFKGTYQRYIPANRSASYLKVMDAIFKDLQSCSFPGPNRVRTEYGEILRISLRIQSECGKIQTWKTPNTDIFYAVTFSR